MTEHAHATPAAAADDDLVGGWSLPIAVAAAAVAVAGVAAWVLWDATTTHAGRAFIAQPQFVVWLLVLCAQGAVWVLAVVPVWRIVASVAAELRERRALDPRAITGIAVATLFVLGLGVVFSVPSGLVPQVGSLGTLARSLEQLPHRWPLPHHSLKMTVLVSFGFAVGLLAVVGIWLVAIAFREIAERGRPTKDVLERFVRLRDQLNFLLAAAGAIIGLGTLATGALHNAVVALHHRHPHRFAHLAFPPEYVLLFGLYYSGLLALAFAPAYLEARRAGRNLRDAAYPLPDATDAFDTALAKRSAFESFLQLNVGANASFKAGVAVFSPLAGSLVGLLLGGK